MAYRRQGVPLVIIAGEDYGIGSSRDWAAKGPYLLGVRAVIARGFERIHRSNLVGMGILPCEFTGDDSAQTLRLDGSESFTLEGLENGLSIRQKLALRIARADGSEQVTTVLVRIDTPVEAQYFRHGGLLPYVLRRQLQKSTAQGAVAR
jgi:aconitate hydratase